MSNHASKSCNNSLECLVQGGRVFPRRVLPFVPFARSELTLSTCVLLTELPSHSRFVCSQQMVQEGLVVPGRIFPFLCFVLLCPLLLVI